MLPSRARRGRALLAALASAFALSACSPGVESAAQPPEGGAFYIFTPEDVAEIRTLMETRARAVLDGDRATFLATVDDADPDVVAQQETTFENLSAMSISGLRYDVDASPGRAEEVLGEDPVASPTVVEHLDLDVLHGTLASSTLITFVRRDGGWVLGRESVDPGVSTRPWVGGPIEAHRSRGVLVLSDAGAEPSAAEISRLVQDDLARAAAVLDLQSRTALVVDATSNSPVILLSDVSGIEARAVTSPLWSGDPDSYRRSARIGMSVGINAGRVAEIVADRDLMRHEMAHVLQPHYSQSLPYWMDEGLAEYVATYPRTVADDRADPATEASGVDLSERPRELADSGSWGDDPPGDYLVARASVEHLVARYGLDRFLALVRAVVRSRTVDSPEATDQALRRAYGISSDKVARRAFRAFRPAS